MNYYERHLGDYARDTAHLTLLEHGVYTILLDRYYVTEQGIPDSQKYRLARARSDEERAAVDTVLMEFFTPVEKTQEKPSGFSSGLDNEKVWINNRADEEIAKARSKICASRENGKKGGRPAKQQEKTQEKPSGFSSGYENKTQQKAHQTPDTNHQTPVLDTNNTHSTPEVISEPKLEGRVCVEYRQMGMIHVTPQHPDLIELVKDGAEIQDFISAGHMATEKGKGFAYALGIVRSRLQEKQKSQSDPSRSHSGSTKNNNSRGNYDRNQHEKQSDTHSLFAEKYAHFIEA
jgi:uncharacterized protein YdaU (DUF1376 family)